MQSGVRRWLTLTSKRFSPPSRLPKTISQNFIQPGSGFYSNRSLTRLLDLPVVTIGTSFKREQNRFWRSRHQSCNRFNHRPLHRRTHGRQSAARPRRSVTTQNQSSWKSPTQRQHVCVTLATVVLATRWDVILCRAAIQVPARLVSETEIGLAASSCC